MKNSLGIYIHIPFCVQKCNYCDFCSAPAGEDLKAQYVSALIKNIESSAKHFSHKIVDSIFFGGGTPTCLPTKKLAEILSAVQSNYTLSDNAEITLECNPATADFSDFKTLVECGFNRLSMGLQSAHNKELKALGRLHTVEDFERTFNDARRARFNNISLDLMYGIPYQTEESFKETLEKAVSFEPEHISAYALKIEPGTLFFKNKESLILPDEDSEYNMYKTAVDLLGKYGYGHYEISNYAKPGFESRHNLKYWNCDDYAGFGISAHSCIGRDRYAVTSNMYDYINTMCSCNDNGYYEITESLTTEEFSEEYIMMRMRLGDGLSERDYQNVFSVDLDPKYIDRLNLFVKSGHIIYNTGRYSFTTDGMYLSNYILSEILDLE